MIYVQGHFLFVHIPRTAGTAITSTLARHQLFIDPFKNILLSTAFKGPIDKHATLNEILDAVPDSRDCYKFAVYRPTAEIVASDYQLQQSDYLYFNAFMQRHGCRPPGFEPAWEGVIHETHEMTLEEFRIARWDPWLEGKSAWEHWTCGDDSVNRYEFHKFNTEWERLLRDIGFPRLTIQTRKSHAMPLAV